MFVLTRCKLKDTSFVLELDMPVNKRKLIDGSLKTQPTQDKY